MGNRYGGAVGLADQLQAADTGRAPVMQGSYRSGKTGKSQGICLVRESQGKLYSLKTVLEKSGKMNQPANYFS